MTEEQLKAAVLELAAMYDWFVFSVTNSTRLVRSGVGYVRVKNINPQGNGFPDLVLVRDRVLYRELKRDLGPRGGGKDVSLSPEQTAWGDRLTQIGEDFAVWRPKDLDSGLVLAELRPRAPAPVP